ncbi:MFS general substrate transporter [Auriscalpium vulgare]|uniref:MFS general substrate transporter n=1 Tax=Auriscalpium vulgare TaxID=40419 RepID=A0ACB8RQE6_9AGAM|nr:MFS general substrate transporter [Auriscalpium vulgare]
MSEREPLLQHERPLPAVGDDELNSNHKPGPMEISRSQRHGILAGIWVATFLTSLNTTVVATLLPSISSDFQRSNQASWLGTSYLLATCTFTPLYGRLCNVMGRRGANQTAVFFAGLGTLACGVSGNMETLILARFLGGLGGGGIFTTAAIITSDMYSIRSRGLTQGIASVFNGLGMGLGGPLGGVISDRFGWRWAFLMQLPLFLLSFMLTSVNLRYTTPGKGKSTKEVLKRIDYGGSATLLGAVLSFLVFLSNRYNNEKPWASGAVWLPLALSVVFLIAFVLFELLIAAEPMLAPYMLKEKIPVLVGISNYLVATCNFAVMYFFPMWFQTVKLTNASTAGLHLLPNSVSMSVGSMFAGWMMHRTGKYKMINLIFGTFPFAAAVLITLMREDSGPVQLWLSIIPLGFGNAVVLQTMLIALLAHLPNSAMAVGTGFAQVFRGMGQVSGVGVASAIFQYTLDRELRARIDGPDSSELIRSIRHSARLVASLPPETQRHARDSYAIALRAVFTMAASATFLAYIVRLPIPDKKLEHSPKKAAARTREGETTPPSVPETPLESDDDDERENGVSPLNSKRRPARRLSTYESSDGGMDLESDEIGGSARRKR